MAKVCMDKKEFNKEHKELDKTLRTGTRAEQKKEASKQEKEIKESVNVNRSNNNG